EALIAGGATRGASSSTVKKWRTGELTFPQPALTAQLDDLLGADGELVELLTEIRRLEQPDELPSAAGRERPAEAAPAPAPEPAAPPAEPTAPAGPAVAEPPPSRRTTLLVVGAVAVVGLVVVAAAVVAARGDGGAVDTAGPRPCPAEVGALDADLTGQANAGLWRDALRSAFADGTRERVATCATAPARRANQLIVQELVPRVGPPAALVVSIDRPADHFYLSPSLWQTYRLLLAPEDPT